MVAGAIVAVLVSGSAAFALSAGLLGADRADRVGTFQSIEQRLDPTTSTTGSFAGPAASGPAASSTTADDAGGQSTRPTGTGASTAPTTSVAGPPDTEPDRTVPETSEVERPGASTTTRVASSSTARSTTSTSEPADDGRSADD